MRSLLVAVAYLVFVAGILLFSEASVVLNAIGLVLGLFVSFLAIEPHPPKEPSHRESEIDLKGQPEKDNVN